MFNSCDHLIFFLQVCLNKVLIWLDHNLDQVISHQKNGKCHAHCRKKILALAFIHSASICLNMKQGFTINCGFLFSFSGVSLKTQFKAQWWWMCLEKKMKRGRMRTCITMQLCVSNGNAWWGRWWWEEEDVCCNVDYFSTIILLLKPIPSKRESGCWIQSAFQTWNLPR